MADLATRLVTADPAAIDHAINDGLQQLGRALRMDRALVWHEPDDGVGPVTTHCWSRATHTAPPDVSRVAAIAFIARRLRASDPVCLTRLAEVGDAADREVLLGHGFGSAAIIPLPGAGEPDGPSGALAFSSQASEHIWPRAVIQQLRIAAGLCSQAIARKAQALELRTALDQLQQLRRHAEGDAALHRPRVAVPVGSCAVVSESSAVRQALAQVEQVAMTPSTVLLLGETGVGKELFAQTIHELSARRQRQMIRVSCSAIPSTLIEAELFGHERGAFTGAVNRQIGRFELANHSTLFLDEIGELSAEVQVKLLRVLQERVIERLGSNQPVKIDVRIVAATNRNLEKAVEDQTFREDLFYRLNVFPIVIPPLRDRVEDIPALAWQFVEECSKAVGKSIESISKESMRQLQAYQWPGNVRELRNVIERAVILATGPRLVVPIPQPAVARQPLVTLTLKKLEIDHIRATLESTNWRVRGHGGAAQRLGLKPTTLETRMAKLGVFRPNRPGAAMD
jgi:transcriptional regulator with GAF, ATPase, and Fis domain